MLLGNTSGCAVSAFSLPSELLKKNERFFYLIMIGILYLFAFKKLSFVIGGYAKCRFYIV